MQHDPPTNNKAETRSFADSLIVMLSASGAYVFLAVAWHYLGLPAKPSEAGYLYSRILMPSLAWTAIVFISVAGGLGWITGRTWPVALGLMLPIPVALWLEIRQDPTSHNLFPFEIVFGWIPLFVLSLIAANVGRRMRKRRRAAPESDPAQH